MSGFRSGNINFSDGAAAFTLTGNSLTLGGHVDNSSANLQTINLGISLPGIRDFIGDGNTLIGGNIGGVGGITKKAGPLLQTGKGTLTLTGNNTYTGLTKVDAGKLLVQGTTTNNGRIRGTSGLVVNSGATAELGSDNMFTTGHTVASGNSRVLTINNVTLLMNTNMVGRIGNVTLNNGSTWTSNRGLGGYDVLLANTSGTGGGAATVTVTGNAASIMYGTGGIHLQGVQNFAVTDVTGNSDADLTVSMILGSQGMCGMARKRSS